MYHFNTAQVSTKIYSLVSKIQKCKKLNLETSVSKLGNVSFQHECPSVRPTERVANKYK